MSRRVSHSLLDPFIAPLVPTLYRALPIPRRFPPEGLVILGHLIAIGGAVGFALSTRFWWGGLLAAIGVAGNHLCDMIDGTHARRTGQCRNGGELLDHFFDPLSFSFWMVGLGVAAARLDLSLAVVIAIYATAVMTSIRAKITGEFSLSRFGPTEFKSLLIILGIALAATSLADGATESVVIWSLWALAVLGGLQLVVGLVQSVRDVNASSAPPDTSEWTRPDEQRDATASSCVDADSP